MSRLWRQTIWCYLVGLLGHKSKTLTRGWRCMRCHFQSRSPTEDRMKMSNLYPYSTKHFVIVTWKAFYRTSFHTFLEGSREKSLGSGQVNILSTRFTESCWTMRDKFVSIKQARCQPEVLLVAHTRIFAWHSLGLDPYIVRAFCSNAFFGELS